MAVDCSKPMRERQHPPDATVESDVRLPRFGTDDASAISIQQ
jgi:hypothetical protein